GGGARLVSNLGRSVGDRGTVLAAGQCPGERSRYDDAMLAAHTGMFPCLRHGRSMRLPRACSRPLMTTFLVSAGSITSSIIAQPAAMLGVIVSRICLIRCARVAAGALAASVTFLVYLLSGPLGPLTQHLHLTPET